jgi:FixJ family two-component response regulator
MQYHRDNKCNGIIEYVENIGESYTQDFVNDENRDILVNRVLTDDRLTDTERYILEKRYNNFKFKLIAKDLNMNVEAVMAKYYKVTDKIRTKW